MSNVSGNGISIFGNVRDFEPSSDRYSRQIRFAPIGSGGQHQLSQKHVLIVGAGALGSASAESLVRAGVGRLTIVDRDYVEWSNLQRQQLYTEEDVRARMPKAIAAKRHLEAINSEVHIEAKVWDVRGEEFIHLIDSVDLIVDASDNFDTRFIINDVALKYQIPWIYGACVGSYGISYTILPHDTPCLSCMMDLISSGQGESCDIDGIIGPAVQMVVTHQVAEALKILTGNEEALHRKLISFDLWSNQYTRINIQSMKHEHCVSCGKEATYPYLSGSIDHGAEEKAAVLCGRDTVHIRPIEKIKLSIDQLAARLGNMERIQIETTNSYLLSANVNALRIVMFNDGRALVHGTADVIEAKQIYKLMLSNQ